MPAYSYNAPLVVLVNDDSVQLELLSGQLSKDAWRVVTFRSATEALSGMIHLQPSVIITDLYMPNIDGWAFCRMLRSAAYRQFNQTPILVLSGVLAGEEAAEIAAELGATDFFPLPVDALRLRERVRALIETPSLPPSWKVLLALPRGNEADEITALFAQHGCVVRLLDDIWAMSTVLASDNWEAVVCDLDLAGCTLAQVSSWTAAAPDSSFVMITSSLAPNASVESLHAGACAHLRRPFAPEYLFGLCELARQKNALIRSQRMLERRTIELRNSDSLIQAILESSEQIYLVMDDSGRVELANRAARKIADEILTGSTAGTGPGLELLPAAMSPRARESLALAMAGGVVNYDTAVTDRTGRRRRFMVRYTPLKDAKGLTTRVCFNAHDMTARLEAEDALRLRNHALSSVSQGVVITGADRRINYVNDSFIAITGFSREEVLGATSGFVQGEDAKTKQVILNALDAGQSFFGAILNYRKNGDPFWNEVSITPVVDAMGVVTQYVGVMRDITESKRQQDELIASRARLQALFDHSKDAILLADDSGRYLEVNPAACQMLGYTREELIQLGFVDIFSAADQEAVKNEWNQFLDTGIQRGECTLICKNGSLLRADYNAIARIQPGLHMAIFRDISERHKLQAQLLRQQRLESVGRLASGVAHDLNNILTPILMAPAMLRSHVADAGARMLLEALESGARRGSAIVQQLLAFSRGEPGEKIRIDLRKTLRDSCAIITETFPKSIILEQSANAGSFLVLGDGNQLQQVIVNLALNGADAMPRGGKLVLGLSEVTISAADAVRDPELVEGHFVLVTVADHGTGIAPDVIDKIFDPFFTTKPFGQGSGLGLSVVLGIIKAHGGFVRVTSRLGVGSIFKVYLPIVNESIAPAVFRPVTTSDYQMSLPVGAGRTIMVVDDENDVREIIRTSLSREGYQVICASGADSAVSQLQAVGGKVDLVLTDLSMPGLSGLKLIEMIHARHPDQPIILMTGDDSKLVITPASREAICGILPKPFEVPALLAAVSHAIRDS